MFSVIVLLHEIGHYSVARFWKIQVDEFGLGIPPRAKKLWKNKAGTIFSLNWIPLGWFVKIAGESPEHPQAKKWHNFFEKNIWQKTSVLIAGVVMNFLLAGIILSVLFFIGVRPVGINTVIPTELPSKIIPTLEQALREGLLVEKEGIVLYPTADSLAQKAGIFEGDILTSINGTPILSMEQAQKIISESKLLEIQLSVVTQCSDTGNCPFDWKREVSITPSLEWRIGSYLSPNYELQKDFLYKYSLLESLKYGFLETYYQSRLTLSGLGILVKNIFSPEKPEDRQEALNQMAGPIGIVSVITESLAGGVMLLCILAALISINLWVFNLLPIPALDGGRILFLWIRTTIETIFWKNKILEKGENIIHIFFFLLLIALSILIAYNDIIKIFLPK